MSEEISTRKTSTDAKKEFCQEFCRLLDDAIVDEEKAPIMYTKLKEKLLYVAHTTQEENPVGVEQDLTMNRIYLSDNILDRNRQDEVNHKKQLEAIKDVFCHCR